MEGKTLIPQLVSVTQKKGLYPTWLPIVIPFLNSRSLSVVRFFDRSNLFYIIIMGDAIERLPVLGTKSAQGYQVNRSGSLVGGPGCVNIKTILEQDSDCSRDHLNLDRQ